MCIYIYTRYLHSSGRDEARADHAQQRRDQLAAPEPGGANQTHMISMYIYIYIYEHIIHIYIYIYTYIMIYNPVHTAVHYKWKCNHASACL